MKRSLRALSVVFGSFALLLGPGQAVAGGDWWDDDSTGWWGGSDGGKRTRNDIREVTACLDQDDLELRVKFKMVGGGHKYFKDIDVAAVMKGDALCVDKRSNGWYDEEEITYFKDVVTREKEANRSRGNKFRAELDLERSEDAICGHNKELVALDIEKTIVLVDGCEFFIDYVSTCDDHWYDGGWEDDRGGKSSWW